MTASPENYVVGESLSGDSSAQEVSRAQRLLLAAGRLDQDSVMNTKVFSALTCCFPTGRFRNANLT